MTEIAMIATDKAERLARALCNHFARRIPATYAGNQGTIEFGDGRCTLTTTAATLTLQIEATDAESLARLKQVVVDHLLRFTPDEAFEIAWRAPA